MRQFTQVIDTMIGALQGNQSEDAKEFQKALFKIRKDARMTAPEVRWEIRGDQVTELLDRFIAEHKELPMWFVKVTSIFTTRPESELILHLPAGHTLAKE